MSVTARMSSTTISAFSNNSLTMRARSSALPKNNTPSSCRTARRSPVFCRMAISSVERVRFENISWPRKLRRTTGRLILMTKISAARRQPEMTPTTTVVITVMPMTAMTTIRSMMSRRRVSGLMFRTRRDTSFMLQRSTIAIPVPSSTAASAALGTAAIAPENPTPTTRITADATSPDNRVRPPARNAAACSAGDAALEIGANNAAAQLPMPCAASSRTGCTSRSVMFCAERSDISVSMLATIANTREIKATLPATLQTCAALPASANNSKGEVNVISGCPITAPISAAGSNDLIA